MKDIRWSKEKDAWLKEHRGVGFEKAAERIESDEILDTIAHWNPGRYPSQSVFVLEIEGYAYCVPFVETEDEIFLKTIIPSRKATRRYLHGD